MWRDWKEGGKQILTLMLMRGGQQPVNAFPKLPEPPGTRDRESGGKRGELTLDQVLTDFKRYFQSQSVKYKPLPETKTPWGFVI